MKEKHQIPTTNIQKNPKLKGPPASGMALA
jgi:hypothetical protein